MHTSVRARSTRRPALSAGVLLAFMAMLTGCGGASFGAELSDRPEPMALTEQTRVVTIPQAQPFSITLAPSQKQPEIGGTAEVTSSAEPSGRARAEASITGGGTASAAFQVGHAFRNAGDRLVDVQVQVDARYRYAVRGDTPDLPLAGAHVNLYAQDERSGSLALLALASHTSDRGDASGQDAKTVSFGFPLGPGRVAHVYLAGNVQIDAGSGHTASGSIELESLQMRIETTPAPPVQGGPSTQPAQGAG